jgi:hypothetical protein
MALILWAFTKVQWGDNRLFDTMGRELMRQMNAEVGGVVEGGGGLFRGIGKDLMEGGRGVLTFD